MNKLLHIIATPRGETSSTRKVSDVFLASFRSTHPGWSIEELDLSKEELPSLTAKRVDGKYVLLGGKDLYGDLREAWQEIVAEIERFLSADAVLISVPMWNFGIPYTLKHYIDVIVQPTYLFRYTATGVEGLAMGRKMVVVTSRGGDYSSEAAKSADFQEPYLRFVFGFTGITDITFINAEPMNMGEEPAKQALAAAQGKARKAAAKI
ncbi:MAG: NAD(P)H-dependent oxidoreductase [bacterium]